jgi:SAM-dependent methyltransferase
MDGNFISIAGSSANVSGKRSSTSADGIIEFYEEAGLDYEHWSRGLNMHLGFYRRGMNPFHREAMLEQMNLEVAARLGVDPGSNSLLLDLGCGMGSIARSVAVNHTNAFIKAFTLVPSHVELAKGLNAEAGLRDRIDVRRGDYIALPLDDRCADAAWAVESACYARGDNKEDLIQEAARVLRAGGRFVVADCFLKKREHQLGALVRRSYRSVCASWVLNEMPVVDEFVAALERNGFHNIVVEDISWRTAPSLAHAPFAVMTFFAKKLLARGAWSRHSINNLKASLLSLLLGLSRSNFSYYLVSGTRGKVE